MDLPPASKILVPQLQPKPICYKTILAFIGSFMSIFGMFLHIIENRYTYIPVIISFEIVIFLYKLEKITRNDIIRFLIIIMGDPNHIITLFGSLIIIMIIIKNNLIISFGIVITIMIGFGIKNIFPVHL